MSVGSTTTAGPPEWGERTGGRQMDLFTNGGVDAEVQIVWHLRTPDNDTISIMFGDEQVTLDFHDVESLERLRDVANQAARRLRAITEANATAAGHGCEASGLVGAGQRSG